MINGANVWNLPVGYDKNYPSANQHKIKFNDGLTYLEMLKCNQTPNSLNCAALSRRLANKPPNHSSLHYNIVQFRLDWRNTQEIHRKLPIFLWQRAHSLLIQSPRIYCFCVQCNVFSFEFIFQADAVIVCYLRFTVRKLTGKYNILKVNLSKNCQFSKPQGKQITFHHITS